MLPFPTGKGDLEHLNNVFPIDRSTATILEGSLVVSFFLEGQEFCGKHAFFHVFVVELSPG